MVWNSKRGKEEEGWESWGRSLGPFNGFNLEMVLLYDALSLSNLRSSRCGALFLMILACERSCGALYLMIFGLGKKAS